MPPKSLRALSFGLPRNIPQRPPSPTFSDVTNVSAMQFGDGGPSKIITRSNLKASIQAYEDLLNTCGAYRAAILTMSKATAAFADAMQRCSVLKGPKYESGTRLQAASGVHHLMGNLWHVLSESLDKGFEKPLRHHLETYKTTVNERSQAYESALREKSQVIRDTETRNMNKKERNLQSFREALAVLQRQVEQLDELKASHYQEIVEHEEEVWDVVQSKVCLVVRSSMDVFDRFTSKTSDPVIEPMLQSVPDPFDAYGPPQAEDKIFSILSPLSISMQTSIPSTSATNTLASTTPERDSVGTMQAIADHKILSWLPGTNGHSSESAEWASLPTSPIARPASPSPPRRPSSPPNDVSLRRHSVPAPTARKAESKLRSVLTVIDEDKTRSHVSAHSPSTSATPSLLAVSTAPPSHPSQLSWNVVNGDDNTANLEGGDETPRTSMLFPSLLKEPPPPDLDIPEHRDHIDDGSDDRIQPELQDTS